MTSPPPPHIFDAHSFESEHWIAPHEIPTSSQLPLGKSTRLRLRRQHTPQQCDTEEEIPIENHGTLTQFLRQASSKPTKGIAATRNNGSTDEDIGSLLNGAHDFLVEGSTFIEANHVHFHFHSHSRKDQGTGHLTCLMLETHCSAIIILRELANVACRKRWFCHCFLFLDLSL